MQILNLKGEVLCEVAGDSLKGVDLGWTNLSRADLSRADLRGADLGQADLRKADLRGVDLRKADLRGADLRGADLSGADLRGANLRAACLRGANLDGAILPSPVVPLEGEFIAYKKVRQADGSCTVIALRIPEDAQRTSALASRKCRASHVVVVEGEGFSPTYEKELHYIPGKTLHADGFDSDRREECTYGIHFFLTREEAEAYQP